MKEKKEYFLQIEVNGGEYVSSNTVITSSSIKKISDYAIKIGNTKIIFGEKIDYLGKVKNKKLK